CSSIICCSEFLRGILVQHHRVPPNKAVTVLNAYHGPRSEDVAETRVEAQQKLGLEPSRRYVLTNCRLMNWKRVDGKNRPLALREENDVELLVAGDGDMELPWKALAAELGVSERVRFLGNVPHQEIPLYIRASDVFVLNSEYEGLSHTLLEVQALGTPMIASGVCGNPEVVEHEVNGLLVDPDRPEELAESLRRVLGDPEMGQRFVEAGHERSAAFDRDTTFSRVEAILREAAGGS
ncbi:MAG: glycosyltransferase family 4 protein, partial [Planctomycetota bacterium]